MRVGLQWCRSVRDTRSDLIFSCTKLNSNKISTSSYINLLSCIFLNK